MSMNNKQIILAKRPEGMPDSDTFSFIDKEIPSIDNGEVLIHTLYVSVDPYMRGRMADVKSYVPPFPVGEVLEGGVIGEINESKSPHFKKGDFVLGSLGWELYSVANEKAVRKIDPSVAPITTYLGVLGMTGLTAYFGLLDIGKPQAGETVVVSGAAGAVGSIVGQIAKIQGARVVGIAGTDEKVQLLKEKLGFDEVINYKTEKNIEKAIETACPNGVDVYFDNVGGDISDAVMQHLNNFARIPVCGAISSYNKTEADIGPRVQSKLVKTRSLMKGFLVGDYSNQVTEAAEQLGKWLSEGKLQYEETIIEGFENIPEAFIGLFEGTNKGKLLVKVAEPESKK
ncbi:NADP-dependent oxidoreductase [Lederbergia lenta]|uniref:NADP-dependent oxidoreductase n=1 Tax=Lederbergia lenta TaxID=1467 RepID=UPI002042306B|nr:NADP-dependent oxidoreductase [Lederbergia lenta]MCM3111728.1 NADP-dependent oxidoreductase [Lederbergia lenta]